MPGFIFLLIMILSAIKSVAQWTVKWAPSIVWTQGKWFLNGWPWVYFERRLWIFILVKKCCFLPRYLASLTSDQTCASAVSASHWDWTLFWREFEEKNLVTIWFHPQRIPEFPKSNHYKKNNWFLSLSIPKLNFLCYLKIIHLIMQILSPPNS